MSERYAKLFSLPENLYAEGSPLIVSAGNLLKDNQTGQVLAQLKIRNISFKTVKAVTVSIHSFDSANLPLEADTTQEYLDLAIPQGGEFGQKVPVPLPNPTARYFAVDVQRVVFSDNSIWAAAGAAWNPLPAAEPLTRTLGDPELVKQYQLTFGAPSEVTPQEYKDLWRCACGAWNRGNTCYGCEKKESALFGLDLEALKADRDARLIREKEEREAQAATEKAAAEKSAAEAAARAKKTKKILTILIPAAVLCIVAILLITKVFIPNSHYKKAKALLDAGQYAEAIPVFEALNGYKDSAVQIKAAKEAIAEQERLVREAQIEAENAAAYQQAEDLLKAGNYDGAIDAFSRIEKYKNSAERLKEAKYAKADSLLSSGEYERAVDAFADLGEYKDSKTKASEAKHQWADSLLSFGQEANYDNNALARELFEQLGDYKDAKDRLQRFRYVPIKETYKYYNHANRPTVFVYDESGRDITHGEVYNEANQVIEDETYTYSYDNNGRLSKKVKKTDDRDRETYTYTERNGLVTEEKRNREFYSDYSKNMSYSKYVYTYKYDDEGRIIWKETTSNVERQHYSTFIYDKEGKLIREDINYIDRYTNKYEKHASHSYRYSYDGDNLIAKSYYEGNKMQNSYTYEYGYIYAPKASIDAE